MSIGEKEAEESKAVWDCFHGKTTAAANRGNKPKKAPKATESLAQQRIFRWAALQWQWPELKLMYHVPNEGAGGNYGRLQKLLSEGLKPGVPDIHLPVSKGGYHGLWIELKVGYNKPTVQQLKWIEELNEQGHYAAWVKGEEAAIGLIAKYMSGELVKGER